MMLLLACMLAYAGFAALALAMDRHHQQAWHGLPSARRRALLRLAGTVGLVASLVICIARSGTGAGIVLWSGLTTLVALTVALLLTYRPGLVALSWPAAWYRRINARR